MLSIPNDAFNQADIETNVRWCENAFEQRGFATSRIATATVPLLLAERKAANAEKTVLVYLQIDGQPVDTSRWAQSSPYKPALKKKNSQGEWEEIPWSNIANYEDDWRVFARSTSDAKGPVSMFLAALDATKEAGINPNYNLKVIMDFEEEMGSPRLPGAVTKNAALLKSDMLIIFDGPRHITNQPTLSFGARGIATVTLTTYGPIAPQHSGHYGNYAPNPALGLSKLLGSMKDDQGRVVIPGYYDGISISEATAQILRAVPDDETAIRERLQIGTVDQARKLYDSGKYIFVDARSLEDYEQGHIQGAVSLPVGQFEEKIAAFLERYPPEASIITYCSGRTCLDSHHLAEFLLEFGYDKVTVFIDGFPGWEAEGHPIE